MKPSVQPDSNSPKNWEKNILIASLAITHQLGWCDVILALCNLALAKRSFHLAQTIRKENVHNSDYWHPKS